MEVKLNDLINSIKVDGIEAANKERDSILRNAEAEAGKIVAAANAEAERIVADAGVEAEKLVSSGEAALKQAGRDLTITVKKSIEGVFENVLRARVSDGLDSGVLKVVIPDVVRALGSNASDVEVLLPSGVLADVEAVLRSELASEIAGGLEIRPFDDLNVGFRVSMRDGSAFYDFTEKEVAKFLGAFLNPKIASFL